MFLHNKKRLNKKDQKNNIVTRFWYSFKNLDSLVFSTLLLYF
jgi:hypothetical protein